MTGPAPEPLAGLRRLGQSDIWITPIGLGTWPFSGTGWNQGWGPTDDAVSVATIRQAVALGINWIDTAATYGIGHAEEVVGRALRTMPATERPFVFTKCGVVRNPDRPLETPVRTLAPASIRSEVEASLRRLGIERIDLLQFHFPDEVGTPIEVSWQTMVQLIQEGKVRAAGVSNFPIALMERCHALRPIDSIQPGLSLIHRDSLTETIPWAHRHGISSIVFSPLRSGLLTDNLTAAAVAAFDPSDWRREHPDFQSPALDRHLALRDALRPIAQRHGTSVSAIAIAWALAWPGVTGVIAGAQAPHEIAAWLTAGSTTLEKQDLDEIETALVILGVGEGPTSSPRSTGGA